MARAKRGGMKVLCIASSKGGSGKSTVAAGLAVQACADGRTVIVDADPQGTLVRWHELRGKRSQPAVVDLRGDLSVALDKLADQDFDFCIIDTPPALMSRIEAAIANADFVLIPSQSSAFDVVP